MEWLKLDSRFVDIYNEIKAYEPFNEQEMRDRELILKFLEGNEDAFMRENRSAHMTASAWVVNSARDKVLMVYHNIYDSWSWLGGHADGDTDLPAVAMREVSEESGIESLRIISDGIYSLEILTVDGHEKRGEYISSHLHMNLTYLIEADDSEAVRIKPDENSAVGWFGLQEAIDASTEPWFQTRIYSKLNAKLQMIEG